MFAELLWVDPDPADRGRGSFTETTPRTTRSSSTCSTAASTPRGHGRTRRNSLSCAPYPATTDTLRRSRWMDRDGGVPMLADGPDASRPWRPSCATTPRSRACGRLSTATRPDRCHGGGREQHSASTPPAAYDSGSGTTRTLPCLTADEAKSADILSLALVAGHPHLLDHVRVHEQDHVCRAGRRVPRRLPGTSPRTSATSSSPRSVRTMLLVRHVQLLRLGPGACATTRFATARSWRRSSPPWTPRRPAPSTASASPSGPGPPVSLREPRCSGNWNWGRRGGPGQGCWHRPAGRSFSARSRPARPQHPPGSVLPAADRGRGRHGRCCDVRRPRRRAGSPPP